jgi:hypothetical protein
MAHSTLVHFDVQGINGCVLNTQLFRSFFAHSYFHFVYFEVPLPGKTKSAKRVCTFFEVTVYAYKQNTMLQKCTKMFVYEFV